MAFLRFSRDKRGYEHFYLVEASTNRRGKSQARVLYWFRTPPGVKVGREPFDDDVRRTLETQNPGVVFDWRKILETPIPSAEAEKWRERRRAEKAEKAARRARAADLVADEPVLDDESDVDAAEAGEDEVGEELDPIADVDAAERQADALPITEESLIAESASISEGSPPAERRRRRRRRRRGGGGPAPAAS